MKEGESRKREKKMREIARDKGGKKERMKKKERKRRDSERTRGGRGKEWGGGETFKRSRCYFCKEMCQVISVAFTHSSYRPSFRMKVKVICV